MCDVCVMCVCLCRLLRSQISVLTCAPCKKHLCVYVRVCMCVCVLLNVVPDSPASSVCVVCSITARATLMAFLILRRSATAPTSIVSLKPGRHPQLVPQGLHATGWKNTCLRPNAFQVYSQGLGSVCVCTLMQSAQPLDTMSAFLRSYRHSLYTKLSFTKPF